METRYRIIEEAVGEGGFGKVHKAMDTVLERQVAIKTLDPLFTIDPSTDDIERFHREARTLARFSHPNIPAIYDVQFTPEEKDFRIIFEWIEGQTVRDFIATKGTMSLEEVRMWFSNLCSALDLAHHEGIIHRDIKPENLIITNSLESCYLVDFGISLNKREIERLTGENIIGTAGYMSPEQERGEELDLTTDLFSLGIVLYECLTGSRPSVGDYSPLSAFNEAIPMAIDDLIRDCFKEKEDRISSAKAFAERLREALKPSASFAKILSSGALSEIQKALGQMEADEFSNLPVGQRILVMTRMTDLINVDESALRRPVVSLLSELVRVAHRSSMDHYEYYIKHALDYGYQVKYGDRWIGDRMGREALIKVALTCSAEAHAKLCSNLLLFIEKEENFKDQEKWYYHDMRNMLQNLLASSTCDEKNAIELGRRLEEVNEYSHKHKD